jgi:hypothetical protein
VLLSLSLSLSLCLFIKSLKGIWTAIDIFDIIIIAGKWEILEGKWRTWHTSIRYLDVRSRDTHIDTRVRAVKS